jgi:dUTP pyrophosphatase
MNIRIQKLHKDAKIPEFAYKNDAGMDLYTPEKVSLRPGERKSIGLGIAIEIPDGYAGLMWDKSGLSHKYGIKTFGGVIDAGYRGEIHAGVMNLSKETYIFEKGHKIIQLIIQKVEHPKIIEVKKLKDSNRNKKGFGSSGK